MRANRGREAAERAAAVGRRVAELGQRLDRLRLGAGISPADLAAARAAAESEQTHADRACQLARQALLNAAAAHHAAAEALEAAGHHDDAEHHRHAAADTAAAERAPMNGG